MPSITSWTSEFGQFTIEPSSATYQTYTLTSTTPFITNWPWVSTANAIATFTTIHATVSDAIFQLPSVLNISIATNFQLKNTGTEDILITTYSEATIFTLGVGNIVNLVVISNANDNASSWLYNQLNVSVETVANASDVAGPGLSVETGLLFPQNIVVDLDLGTGPSPYVLSPMQPNTTFVIRPAGGSILLPDATTSDIGSQMTFKNSSNGSVIIQTNSTNAYLIDLNTTSGSGAPYGNTSIALAPNECVVIQYDGPVNFPISLQTYYMYYTLAKVNQISSLLSQATLDLPSTPPVSPTVIGATVVMTDIINFFDSTGTATGTYTYNIPYPVNKVYYVTLSSSQSSDIFPEVILNFGNGGAGFQVILSYTVQIVFIFVQSNGQVVIFGAQGPGSIGFNLPALTIVGNNTTSTSPPRAFTVSEFQGEPENPLMLFPCLSCDDLQNSTYSLTNYPDSASSLTIFGKQQGFTDGDGNPVQQIKVTTGTNYSLIKQSFDTTGTYPLVHIASPVGVKNVRFDTSYTDGGDGNFKPTITLTSNVDSNYGASFIVVPADISTNYRGVVTQLANGVDSTSFNIFTQYPDINGKPISAWYSQVTGVTETGIKQYYNSGGGTWMRPELVGTVASLGTNNNSIATIKDINDVEATVTALAATVTANEGAAQQFSLVDSGGNSWFINAISINGTFPTSRAVLNGTISFSIPSGSNSYTVNIVSGGILTGAPIVGIDAAVSLPDPSQYSNFGVLDIHNSGNNLVLQTNNLSGSSIPIAVIFTMNVFV